jgi:hypothetical protein
MRFPPHLPVYRAPVSECPSFHTFTLHVNALCQFQWDYTIDWPGATQPKIWIFGYRCFQREESTGEFRQVDQIPFDVPVWDGLIQHITRHAAETLYNSAEVVGDLSPVTPTFEAGAAEASEKRFDMRKYREMSQRSYKADSDRQREEV